MKRVFSWILLFIFLYNTIGYYPFFLSIQKYAKHEIKKRIKKHVPENDLTVLTFNCNSEEYKKLVWLEDHEFRYKGKMYDFVRKTIEKNGVITYYCINDKQEEKLFANLDEHVENQAEQNGQKDAKNFIKKLLSEYVSPTPYFFTQFYSTTVNYIENRILLSQSCQDISTPPPDSL